VKIQDYYNRAHLLKLYFDKKKPNVDLLIFIGMMLGAWGMVAIIYYSTM
jgi:hypothetical protein